MANPIAIERVVTYHNEPAYRDIIVFCPGCQQQHRFTVEILNGSFTRADGSAKPVWTFDGNFERPTFTPSMLAYSTVHLCPEDYVHYEVCEDPDNCGNIGHAILNDDLTPHKIDQAEPEKRIYGHNKPHVVEPAWGNCHSFLTNGQWQFLGDSAHKLAGQTVPAVPLPDWMVKSRA
jgi:hypothetical protein